VIQYNEKISKLFLYNSAKSAIALLRSEILRNTNYQIDLIVSTLENASKAKEKRITTSHRVMLYSFDLLLSSETLSLVTEEQRNELGKYYLNAKFVNDRLDRLFEMSSNPFLPQDFYKGYCVKTVDVAKELHERSRMLINMLNDLNNRWKTKLVEIKYDLEYVNVLKQLDEQLPSGKENGSGVNLGYRRFLYDGNHRFAYFALREIKRDMKIQTTPFAFFIDDSNRLYASQVKYNNVEITIVDDSIYNIKSLEVGNITGDARDELAILIETTNGAVILKCYEFDITVNKWKPLEVEKPIIKKASSKEMDLNEAYLELIDLHNDGLLDINLQKTEREPQPGFLTWSWGKSTLQRSRYINFWTSKSYFE